MTVLFADNDGTPICLKGTNPDEDWIVFSQEDADALEAILLDLHSEGPDDDHS